MIKSLLTILSLLKKYPTASGLNIFFNFLYSIFSLVSLAMIGPFLNILFDKIEPITEAPVFSWDVNVMIQQFYYQLGQIINQYDKATGLLFVCILVGLAFLIKNMARYGALYFLAPIRNGIVRDLRRQIYQKILRLPVAYFSTKRKGDLLARTSVDVQEVEWGVLGAIEGVFKEPLTFGVYLFALIKISPQMTLIAMLILPITGLVIGRLSRSLKRNSATAQNEQGHLLSMFEETIGGLRIIKAFNAQESREEQFTNINDGQTKSMNKVARRKSLASPMTEVLGIVVVIFILYFGGKIVLDASNKSLDADSFIAFVLIFSQIINPIKSFTGAWYKMIKGVASMKRINALLQIESINDDEKGTKPLTHFETAISFENLSFAFDDGFQVLNNIDAVIPKGKTVALVGPSGAGKSTLVDLVLKFYQPTQGKISIDGISLNEISTQSLRSKIGLVTQEAILFNDTIISNLRLGNPTATEAEVIAAAKAANAHDFISRTENGYHTRIGDMGNTLSGGERQRLTIARALLKNPPILILDEATSALDAQSEKLVQEALERVMKNRTSLIIAHRFSTIQHADEIWVMDRGQIVERGTPETLGGQDSQYRKLAELQRF